MSASHDEIARHLDASASALAALRDRADAIAAIADRVAAALEAGGTLFLCGNGGSAAQCQHIAAEFTGRFQLERPGYRAVALTTDTSALTAIGNDYGFDDVFARQVEALARPGDVLMGLSTSGNSENVVRAFEVARRLGVAVIALVGSRPARMAEGADLRLAVPGEGSAVVQECHLAALHAVCAVVERRLAAPQP